MAAGVLAKSGRVLLQQRSDPPAGGAVGVPRRQGGPRRDARKSSRRASSTRSSPYPVEETDVEPIAFTSHPLDDARNLLMPVYGVLAWAGEPGGAEGQPLAWVTADGLGSDARPCRPPTTPA